MSRVLSLKLQDRVYAEAEEILRTSRKARKLLKRDLAKESALVAADSMEVLETFERLENELGE